MNEELSSNRQQPQERYTGNNSQRSRNRQLSFGLPFEGPRRLRQTSFGLGLSFGKDKDDDDDDDENNDDDDDDDNESPDKIGGVCATDSHAHQKQQDGNNDHDHDHGNEKKTWGRGIVSDFRRTVLTHWVKEMTNLNQTVIATTFFLFFACIAPAITFGKFKEK
jgi:hypothetical protein